MEKCTKESWIKLITDNIKYPQTITNEWIDEKHKKWLNSPNKNKEEWEIIWRWGFCYKDMSGYDLSQLDKEHMALLTFNSSTIWPSKDKMPKDFDPQSILERGKNPMLRIGDLHKQGITGKGVVVACIDSGFQGENHIELKNSNLHVQNFATDCTHLHGEGVLANLLGKNIGVAPEVECYYYSVNQRHGALYAEMICKVFDDIKAKIESGIEIRAISRSGALYSMDFYEKNKNKEWVLPTINEIYGNLDNFKKVAKKIKELNDLGCVVVNSKKFGQDFTCCGIKYYEDNRDVDNYKLEDWYLPTNINKENIKKYMDHKPISFVCAGKVVPEFCDDNGYKFEQVGCYSWTIPQVVGMYALCLQVNKNLTWDEYVKISKSTAKMNRNYAFVANPKEIIKEVERLKMAQEDLEV